MNINGSLNFCKPVGKTSFDIVRLVKQLTRQKKVGHGGTLDPLASGVLPICIGQATRVTEFLAEADKSYKADLVLGVSTDTYDAEGQVIATRDSSGVTRELLEEALKSFRGAIDQEPPMYSALKHEGKRLYQLAREGVVVERKKRSTMIYKLELADWAHPVVTIEVECGRGAYIRSLAHDIGEALGCGAHLKSLVRLSTGPFDIRDSVGIEDFSVAAEQDTWQELLYPVDFVLQGMDSAILNQRSERAVLSGQSVMVPPAEITGNQPEPSAEKQYRLRAYSADGKFLAILTSPGPRGPWAPKKVFSLT